MKLIRKYYGFNIDLFASYLNKKHKRFVSWKNDPEVSFVNAFLIDWSQFTPFIFSPFSIIHRVLRKIIQDGMVQAICIFPYFHTSVWFPQMMKMCVKNPMLLPHWVTKQLKLPWDPNSRHPLVSKMRLLLVVLSGHCSRNRGLSQNYADQVASFAWRRSSNCVIGSALKKWLEFCLKNNRNRFDFKLKNILDCLNFIFQKQGIAFGGLRTTKNTLLEMRKLAGMKTSKNHINYVNKYMRACFNQKPPSKRSYKMIWDVNLLLDFFNKSKPNSELSCNELGGKAMLLIMLTTMCRKAEVSQLKLSNVVRTENGDLRFHLEEPTKTYNERNFTNQTGLQKLIVPRVPQNRKLCPVTALEDYLEKVEFVRGNLDEVFILLKDPSLPAKNQTLARWCKDILHQAGIENYGIHSVRSASTCGALIRGVPLDKIIKQAGWSQVNSFIRNYLKPLKSSQTGQECTESAGKTHFSQFPQTTDKEKVVSSAEPHTRLLPSGKQMSVNQ